jgi:alanyl-tRNA synthetase
VLEEFRGIPIERAKKMGAMALFGEKYGDEVRVIRFGESIELCGGTHVGRTGEIGFFKITSEGSVASGIRRIEATTALAAEKFIFDQLDLLDTLSDRLKAPVDLLKSVDAFLDENQRMVKDIEGYKHKQAMQMKGELESSVEQIDGVNFIARKVDLDADQVKTIAFQLRKELAPLFLVLATSENDKATLSVALSDDLVESKRFNSGNIVRELSAFIKGGGGGQPFFATAGGKDPQGIERALSRSRELLSES